MPMTELSILYALLRLTEVSCFYSVAGPRLFLVDYIIGSIFA